MYKVSIQLARILFLLSILSISGANAQDDDEAVTKNEETQNQESEKDSTEQANSEIVTPDRIEVTEQFSKDIPADFPVDI